MRFKWLQYVLHAAVLGGLILAGLKYIDGEQFTRAISRFYWPYAPVICLLGVASVLVKGWRFAQLMRELVDATRSMFVRVYLAGQSCTLLPGGGAARAGMLKQAGIPAAQTAAPLALSSLTDQAMFLLCALVAALWFESARRPVFILLGVLAAVSIVLGVEASRTWLLGVIDRLMGRFKWRDRWQEFKESFKQVATPKLLLGGLANTAVSFALVLTALHLALRGVDASVPPATLLLAFALPTMLGRISAMPGGVGVTEAGMIGVLDHAPGVSLDQAAAAVTVFRLGTVLFSALVGGLVYLFAWRGAKEKELVEEGAAAAKEGEDTPTASAAVGEVRPA
ncbi:MAG TPA: lysylphosphatidylglycerol synthase transmembrane domain-containing protein [Armatimonadaceae bacterium]|nr:lysylphosphatidylglycerol synthase transmembrane domain-containing protein [Armatimonadaceae bacterium]